MKTTLPVTVAIIAVLLYFTGVFTDNHILRVIVKPLPLIAFLFMLKPSTHYRKFIFAGLLLSLTGDILLEVTPDWFLYGLVSFLLAHIAYIFAFSRRSRKKGLPVLIILLFFGVAIYYVLYPGLNDMAIPVLFYLAVILTMAWRALVQRNYDKYAVFAAAGALFFVFSDSIIAIDKFYTAVPFSRWIIMSTYWTAQTLIFYSAYNSLNSSDN